MPRFSAAFHPGKGIDPGRPPEITSIQSSRSRFNISLKWQRRYHNEPSQFCSGIAKLQHVDNQKIRGNFKKSSFLFWLL